MDVFGAGVLILALSPLSPAAHGAGGGGVTAITSATPRMGGHELTEAHAGYKQANCHACHLGAHAEIYRITECASCHGTNGAPPRPTPHAAYGCQKCHSGSHPGLWIDESGNCATCHPGRPSSSSACSSIESADVAVIGAGGGGLSAAASLAASGLKVVVLEKSAKVGGCMTNFRVGDFRFEVSLHGFDGLDPIQGLNADLFSRLGIAGKVQPIAVRPNPYRVVLPGLSVDVPAELDSYQALLIHRYPLERPGIEELFSEIRDLHQLLRRISWQAGEEGGEGMSLTEISKLLDYQDASFSETMARYLHDPELIRLVSMLVLGYSVTAVQDLSALVGLAVLGSYHIGGFYYFVGGSQAVSDALAEAIVEHGGKIRTGSLVDRIVIEDGLATEVHTTDGACVRARYVVSNASAESTIRQLVGEEHFPVEYVERLRGMKGNAAALIVFLGLDTDLSGAFGASHEIIVAADEDALPSDPFSEAACEINGNGLIATNYSMVDPSTAPSGKTALVLCTNFSYDCLAGLTKGGDLAAYRQRKEELAKRLIAKTEKLLPGLSRHIQVMEVSTPQTVEGYTLNPRGNFMGWDLTRDQSFFNRLPQQTPIPNLLLAGAWTFPGGGQSAVLQSGLHAASLILEAIKNASAVRP